MLLPGAIYARSQLFSFASKDLVNKDGVWS